MREADERAVIAASRRQLRDAIPRFTPRIQCADA